MKRRTFLSLTGGALAALRTDALSRVEAASRAVTGVPAADVATDEDFWFHVRHAFTVDRNSINLNNGSVSPSPRVVQEAMQQYLEITNMSPSLYVDELLAPQIEEVRRRLAAAFGCDTEEMAITRNTSESMQIVQFGLDLRPGDEILTTSQDYDRMLTAWRQREQRDGVVLKTFSFPVPPPSMDDLVERFEKNITSRTKVILLSHVTYTTGQIFPVKRICQMARARGIETMVDGAHGFAHFPFTRDDLDCDYYGTSLHKWLTAPVGTGFLYVRREKIAGLWPLMAAPASQKGNIRKFEQIGTSPVANRNAITEALTFHDSIGAERKAARLRYLRERWVGQVEDLPNVRILNPKGPEHACALGALELRGVEGPRLTDWLLANHRIHVRPRVLVGQYSAIRVTPNVYTTLAEVDVFARAIREAATKGI
jgi:selenocysteine lyase/cysteine desulfurase